MPDRQIKTCNPCRVTMQVNLINAITGLVTNHTKMRFIKAEISMALQREQPDWLWLISLWEPWLCSHRSFGRKKKKNVGIKRRERKPWPDIGAGSWVEVTMCSILGCNEMSCSLELAQSQLPETVWMVEEELVANELKGSRNSGGIGRGELTCAGFTLRQWCGGSRWSWGKQRWMVPPCCSLGSNYRLIQSSRWRWCWFISLLFLMSVHAFHISSYRPAVSYMGSGESQCLFLFDDFSLSLAFFSLIEGKKTHPCEGSTESPTLLYSF